MFCRNNLTGHHNTSGSTRYHIISYCVVSYEQKYTFKSIFSRFSDPLEMRLKEYDKATYTLHSVFACNDERPRHIKRWPITMLQYFRKLVFDSRSS